MLINTLSKTRMFLFVGLFASLPAFAQNPILLFGETEVSLAFKSAENWSHTLEIGDRYLFSEYYDGEQVEDFGNEHLEVSHFSKYSTTEQSAFSLGVRYRFREAFDGSKNNELRFVEQYSYTQPGTIWSLSHRVRTEQRLRTVETIHRFRYQLEADRPLSEVFALVLETEALLSVSPQDSPGWEQRFGIGIENSSFKNLSLSISVQYQMEDYNKDLQHEIFLLTGVGIKI